VIATMWKRMVAWPTTRINPTGWLAPGYPSRHTPGSLAIRFNSGAAGQPDRHRNDGRRRDAMKSQGAANGRCSTRVAGGTMLSTSPPLKMIWEEVSACRTDPVTERSHIDQSLESLAASITELLRSWSTPGVPRRLKPLQKPPEICQ
jgi:hypothetical protein